MVVLYGEAPDGRAYEEHAALCRLEWEFADDESFKAAARSDEFMATGKDAYKRGFPQPTVEFVSLA